jgi:hypothetical protein
MAKKATKTATIRPRNNGMAIGLIGGAICLALLGVAAWGGYYLYHTGYGTANAQAQMHQQFDQLRTQLATELDRRLPPVRPNGPINNFGVDPNGQPNHAAGTVTGLYDELHGENTALKSDLVALKDVTKAQGDAMKTATDNLAAQIKASTDSQKAANDALAGNIATVVAAQTKQGSTLDDVVLRVGKIEAAQATPAPAPVPQTQAPSAAPQYQAPANPAPAATSQAAPAGQSGPQVAQGGDVNLVVPKWMHIQIDGEPNDHVKACVAPHHAEIDFKSPKCFDTGRKNQFGKPIINCPNKCV